MLKQWLELSIETPREDEEVVVALLEPVAYGGAVVEEGYAVALWEGESPRPPLFVTVKAYLPLDAAAAAKEERIDEGYRRLSSLHRWGPLQRRVLDEEDWTETWKVHYPAIPVGERLIIVPAWLALPEGSERLPLVLDPGLAFGTGQHASTRLALALLEKHLCPGDRVLDWGTGSGILAIAAARLGAGSVLALDIDPVAVQAARANLARNGAQGRVQVLEGGLEFPNVPLQPEFVPPYHLAMANISYRALAEGVPTLWKLLVPGGRLILSGLLRWNRDQLAREIEALGAEVLERSDEEDWGALAVQRPSPLGR